MKTTDFIKKHKTDKGLVYRLIREGFIKKSNSGEIDEMQAIKTLNEFYDTRDLNFVTNGNPDEEKRPMVHPEPSDSPPHYWVIESLYKYLATLDHDFMQLHKTEFPDIPIDPKQKSKLKKMAISVLNLTKLERVQKHLDDIEFCELMDSE